MKKSFLTAFTALVLPLLALAQGWPANYGGVMLQGFWWDSYYQTNVTMQNYNKSGYLMDGWTVPTTRWNDLLANIDQLAPYFDIIWLPQSGATNASPYLSDGITRNPDCMGFVPICWLDHGNNRSYSNMWGVSNSVTKSYFGTETELRNLIAAYKAKGVGMIEDVVINHKGGLGGANRYGTDFVNESVVGPRTGKTYTINWSLKDICNDDECVGNVSGASKSDFGAKDCAGQGTWARDLDHDGANVQKNVKTYLTYLKDELGYAGFRYDYARGFEPKHFGDYNSTVRPTFSVGEFWDWSAGVVTPFIDNAFGCSDYQSGAFDFPLMGHMKKSFQPEKYQDSETTQENYGKYKEGNKQYWFALADAALFNDPLYRRYAVTFVDNHDTFKSLESDWTGFKDRLDQNIVEANAFILLMPGTPCLFYPHFMNPDWRPHLIKFIKMRHAAGITNESGLSDPTKYGTDSNQQGISYVVTGNKGKAYIYVGFNGTTHSGAPSGFHEVWKGSAAYIALDNQAYANYQPMIAAGYDDYNIREPQVNGYPVIDKTSCTFDGSITVNIKPSIDGCTVVYSTDGTDPVVGNTHVTDAVNGTDVTFDASTTLKVGTLVGDEVAQSTIEKREYIKNAAAASKFTVYVKADDAPNLYLWTKNASGDNVEINGAWSGAKASSTKTVGGVTWYYKEFTTSLVNPYNLIINWNGGSQTNDITGLTGDAFFILRNGQAFNVTETYINAVDNPTVEIDLPSGEYGTTITPKLTASNSGATIVYTTDGSAPTASSSQITYQGTVNMTGTGSRTLRAAILLNGNIINPVARTYNLSTNAGWKASTVETSGINLYIHTSDDAAPYIHTWDTYNGLPDNRTAVTALGSGTPEILTLKKRTTSDSKTWWYYHVDATEMHFLICNNTSYGSQTADQHIFNAGCYFFDYNNGSFTDCTSSYVKTTTGASQYSDSGFNVFVINKSNSNEPQINLYQEGVWGTGFQNGIKVYTTDGQQWYYKHDSHKTDAYIQFAAKKNNSDDMAYSNAVLKSTNNSYLFYFYPDGYGNRYEDKSSNYKSYLPTRDTQTIRFSQQDYVSASATLPACATYVPNGLFAYFENSAPFSTPYAWIYDSNDSYTGKSWPGEALVEAVGVAQNGNMVYRWTYPKDTVLPTNAIFSDRGENQTSTFSFVKGGYYTATSHVGTVQPQNLMSLADIVKSGTPGQTYTIANDVYCVYVDDNGTMGIVKDANGQSNKMSTRAADQTDYMGRSLYQTGDYDQSNWIKIVFNTANANNKTTYRGQAGQGKKLLAQTVTGTLRVDANGNPSLELSAAPITGDVITYTPNTYIPANFMDKHTSISNVDYFFMKPKAMEYARVVWAIYNASANAFFVPSPEGGQNNGHISGGVSFSAAGLGTFSDGAQYEIECVVMKKSSSSSPAPRKASSPYTGGGVSSDYEIMVLSASTPLVTDVHDVKVNPNKEVASVLYYNLAGMASHKPFEGMNIVVTRYTDGTSTAVKMVK